MRSRFNRIGSNERETSLRCMVVIGVTKEYAHLEIVFKEVEAFFRLASIQVWQVV